MARVQFPAAAECFKGFFPGWSHSANPFWSSVAENGAISPNGSTQPVDIKEEGWNK